MYTLDIVSKYLGFIDWDDLQINLESEEDSHFLDSDLYLLRSTAIEAGKILEIGYAKCRKLELRCMGNSFFRVLKSQKREIRKNDSLEIFLFWEKLPLYVSSVIRNGENLGGFILEKKKGISYIITKDRNDGK
jgi:hypothetical protein